MSPIKEIYVTLFDWYPDYDHNLLSGTARLSPIGRTRSIAFNENVKFFQKLNLCSVIDSPPLISAKNRKSFPCGPPGYHPLRHGRVFRLKGHDELACVDIALRTHVSVH